MRDRSTRVEGGPTVLRDAATARPDRRLPRGARAVDYGARRPIRVVLFCGGRGGTEISRALLHQEEVHLSLIINGYDDGRSTGAVRALLPGMLGPSDFRKNLTNLIDPRSDQQDALRKLLEYRLTGSALPSAFRNPESFWLRPGPAEPHADLLSLLDRLAPAVRRQVLAYLHAFVSSLDDRSVISSLTGMSMGNLIFAGAYLTIGSFNETARALAELCRLKAQILNVSRGESRWLAALKEDGTLLAREAEIVGPQSAAPIKDIYLLERCIEPDERSELCCRPVQDKDAWLRARERPVGLSEEAADAIARADILIYGPGTQHSSLLPSYRIAAAAIRASRAPVKALVINLRTDYDIQNFSGTDIVDRALWFMGDPTNDDHAITHLIYDLPQRFPYHGGIFFDADLCPADGYYRGAEIIAGHFHNPLRPTVHSGMKVARYVTSILEAAVGESSDYRLGDVTG